MADDRTLSLGTKFTADSRSLLSGIRAIRKEMGKLNQVMGKQAGVMGAGGRTDKSLQKTMLSYGRLGATLGQFADRSPKWQKAFSRLIEYHKPQSAAAVKNMASALDKVHGAVAGQVNALRAAGKQYSGLLTSTNLYEKTQKSLIQSGVKYERQLEGINTSTKKVYDSNNLFNRQLSRIGDGMERLKAAFKVTAAYGIAATAIFSVTNALKSGIAEIVNYDQALKNLQAITKASDAEVRAMGKAIKEVATRTKYSTTEVAEAMVILGQAGFSASESIAAIGAVANLATGTLTDMAIAADLLTTIIRAFGKEAFQASEISDIMANAINRSKLTIDKLRIAFNYVGPSADATGTSLEEVSAAMMALANSGLRASTIGTGLRQIFARLVAPSAKLQEKMESHGIAVEDLNIRVHGFAGVLENLKDMFYDVEKGTLDARKGFELFGLRGANAILALIKAVESGNFDQYLQYVYEVGTAGEMAATQIEGLALKFKNLTDRAKLLAVELGENGVGGTIGVLLDGLKALVNVVTAFVQTSAGKLITALLLIKGAMYLTVTTGALLTSLFKWLVTFFGSKAGAIIGGFWGRLVFAVLGAVAVFKTFTKSSKETIMDLQDQKIALLKTVDQMAFYRKALKDAAKEMEENKDATYKYDAVIERLKTAFPKLAKEIERFRYEFEKIDALLEKTAAKNLEEAIKRASDEYDVMQDRARTKSIARGYIEMGKEEVGILKERLEQAKKNMEQDKKRYPATYDAQEMLLKGYKKFREYDIKAGREILSWFTEPYRVVEGLVTGANKVAKELGDTLEKTKQDVESSKEGLESLAVMYAKYYKDQKLSLKEVYMAVKVHPNMLKKTASEIETIAILTRQKVEDLRRAVTEPYKYAGIETVLTRIWKQADAAQREGLKSRQKQLESELSTFKGFLKKHEELQKDSLQTEVSIKLKAWLEMKELLAEEGLVEYALYQKREEWLKELTRVFIDETNKTEKNMVGAEKYKLKAINLTESKIKKINERVADLEKQAQDRRVAIYTESERLIQEIRKEGAKLISAEEIKLDKESNDKLYEQKSRNAERDVMLRVRTEEQANVDLAKEAEKHAQKDYDNLKAHLSKHYTKEEAHTDDVIELKKRIAEAESALLDAQLAKEKVIHTERKDLLQKELEHMDGYYKAGWISAEAYYAKLKEAQELGLITDKEEMKDLETRLRGNMWENFINGVDKARKGLDTMNDVLADLGENFAGVFADGVIDAFDALVDGSKNAKEAFSDFAVDTLNWMAKIIMRAMLMKAVTGLFPSLGMATAGGSTSAAVAASVGHKGGVVGETPAPIRFVDPYVFANAKRLHRGLTPDEVPAILQRGETVLPKGQGVNLQVEVINKTEVPMQGEQGETRFDGEKYITDIHLTKLITNRNYRQAHRRL